MVYYMKKINAEYSAINIITPVAGGEQFLLK